MSDCLTGRLRSGQQLIDRRPGHGRVLAEIETGSVKAEDLDRRAQPARPQAGDARAGMLGEQKLLPTQPSPLADLLRVRPNRP